MNKWNKILILLLALILSVSMFSGCGKNEDSFAAGKAPDGIDKKLYKDTMTVIDDAMEIQDEFNEKFSTYEDSDEYHDRLLAWFDNLSQHKLIEKYINKEESFSEDEINLYNKTRHLYGEILNLYIAIGGNLEEGVIEFHEDAVSLQIEELKEIIDIDISEEDFIK